GRATVARTPSVPSASISRHADADVVEAHVVQLDFGVPDPAPNAADGDGIDRRAAGEDITPIDRQHIVHPHPDDAGAALLLVNLHLVPDAPRELDLVHVF